MQPLKKKHLKCFSDSPSSLFNIRTLRNLQQFNLWYFEFMMPKLYTHVAETVFTILILFLFSPSLFSPFSLSQHDALAWWRKLNHKVKKQTLQSKPDIFLMENSDACLNHSTITNAPVPSTSLFSSLIRRDRDKPEDHVAAASSPSHSF